jgi:VCBS repeat protein
LKNGTKTIEMKRKKAALVLGILIVVNFGCENSENQNISKIDESMFEHHYITQDLPGKSDWGYGCPTLADFDNDGDLDYSFSRLEGIYWFENQDSETWLRHDVGKLAIVSLGADTMDVDGDGWVDIVVGGYWYRNSQNPKNIQFERYQYDNRIKTDVHDVVMADMDGDGKDDVVVTGEGEGLFWYAIPGNPIQDWNWERTTVTLDVLIKNDRIHAGFFPKGIGDLDGDGDKDVVLPDRWLENKLKGEVWVKHQLPFGKRGPYGLSSRSWIVDLDKDGDNDIVMTDCDQQASRAAWLENHGEATPTFTAHFLPMTALGIRGSFHTLYVGDLDNDGDKDILTCDQEDDTLPPEGATPRWYIWENISTSSDVKFVEKVILDNKIGGHDALVGDADGDGDLDIFSKVWNLWPGSANNGVEHGDFLENKIN